MSFVEAKEKKRNVEKKKIQIFSKQFVTTEPTKYGLKKKTFKWMSFVEDKQQEKSNVEKRKENI